MDTTLVDIQIDDHGAQEALEAFPAMKGVVISRALNRTAAWARTRTLEAITGNLNIKKGDLDGRHRFGGVTVSKSTPERLEAKVSVTGDRIPLFLFKGNPKGPPSPNGISYQIDAGGGRKRQTVNAFVAVMSSDHTAFFKRWAEGSKHVKIIAKTGKRAGKSIWSERPLVELYGPSIPHVAENQPAFKKLLEVDASERLALQLERETNFVLTGNSSTSIAEEKDG